MPSPRTTTLLPQFHYLQNVFFFCICLSTIYNYRGGPTTNEHAHGCPFLHWSAQDLKKGLSNTGITESDVEDILYVTKLQPGGRSSGCRTSKDACNGCARHFQAIHGDPAPPHETPNDWFVHSTRHFIPARGGMC